MPFVSDILRYRSLSIVGLEKNTGKTVCLNYLLRRLHDMRIGTAVTSIGVDGEQCDAVFGTAKPEVTIYEGMQFVTSEQHYLQRRVVSRLLRMEEQRTSLGRLVTAEVLVGGKVLLSGAATTEKLRQQIAEFREQGVPLTIVDGALSRLSLASPTVTDAMILATGAAVSPDLQQLVSRTRYVCRLISLSEVEEGLRQRLSAIRNGLWAVDSDGEAHDLGISSVFLLRDGGQDLFRHGNTLFVSGAVSDRLLRYLMAQRNIKEQTLIVRDFTKLFVSQEVYAEYVKRGGALRVLQQSKLVGVCLNPTSPQGYRLNSREACRVLSDTLGLDVVDVLADTQI